MRFAVFTVTFISVLGLAGAYVCWRLFAPTKISRRWIAAATAGIMFAIGITPATLFLRRYGLENQAVDLLVWVGYMALGFLSLVFTFLVLRDVVTGIAAIPRIFVAQLRRRMPAPKSDDRPADPERRRMLLKFSNIGVITGASLFTAYGVAEAKDVPAVKTVRIPFENLPEGLNGFRIVQITDIHVSPTTKYPFVRGVVDVVNQLSPDLVALTGDLVDGSVSRLAGDVAPLADLSATYGNFFVTGNHEYYSGVLPWVRQMHRLGFTVLLNEHQVIEKDGGRLLVAGVTDYRGGRFFADHRSDPHKALDGAPHADLKLLLAHQPRSIFDAAAAGFDLQISGHTHGGQFFPWNYVVFLTQPYVTGLHRHDNTQIYISAGTGYWGPPLRIGSPSEITLIELVKA